MSTRNKTTHRHLSIANFTAIFEAASNEYRTSTGQDLETHPFAAALEDYNTPDFVLNVYRKQARAFDKFRKVDDKLMAWLTPTVYILFTVSETLGDGISPVSIQLFYDISVLQHPFSQPFSAAKALFTAIGVLLGVSLFPHSSIVHSHNSQLRS